MRMMRGTRFYRSSCCVGLVSALLSAGCARDLVFTTYTTLGLELKGVAGEIPTSVALAYKRFEGAMVPVDPNTDEEAHSVLASIDAEQSLWSVRVNQVFATGEAAREAAKTEKEQAEAGRPGPMAGAIQALRAEKSK